MSRYVRYYIQRQENDCFPVSLINILRWYRLPVTFRKDYNFFLEICNFNDRDGGTSWEYIKETFNLCFKIKESQARFKLLFNNSSELTKPFFETKVFPGLKFKEKDLSFQWLYDFLDKNCLYFVCVYSESENIRHVFLIDNKRKLTPKLKCINYQHEIKVSEWTDIKDLDKRWSIDFIVEFRDADNRKAKRTT